MPFTARRRIAPVLAVVICAASSLVSGPTARANTNAQFDFGGLTRTYTLHVPPGLEHPSALVINLHAGGASGSDQAALTHYDSVADAHGFVVAYPDGIDRSWADGRGASVPDRQGVDDVGFISALVAELVGEYGIPPGRVFATGLSAGAFMANRLGCDRAELFAAIAPVAGTLGTNVACNPSRPIAVIETHGTADPIVPYDGGAMDGRGGASVIRPATAMVDLWRRVDACTDAPAEEVLGDTSEGSLTYRDTSSACAPGTSVVFMRIVGGGHTWPGAPIVGPAELFGSTTHAFDASEASWQFFDTHGR